MSFHAQVWAYGQKVSAPEKAVLALLSFRANNENSCWPGAKSIATDTSLSIKTVRRSIDKLRKAGLVAVERQRTLRGRDTTSLYVLRVSGRANDTLATDDVATVGPSKRDTVTTRRGTLRPSRGGHHDHDVRGQHDHQIYQKEQYIVTPADGVALNADVDLAQKFEEFWSAYPRKIGKEAARVEFIKAMASTPLAEIALGLRRMMRNPPADPRYIPSPTRWLAAKRWTDEPLAPGARIEPRQPRASKPTGDWGKTAQELGL